MDSVFYALQQVNKLPKRLFQRKSSEKRLNIVMIKEQSKQEVTYIYRSSHRRCSVKKDVFRNFTKFTGKHLRQSLFFNKVAGLSPTTLLKKRLWHRFFPVNFVKFLRTAFLQNGSGQLLLYIYTHTHVTTQIL